MAEFPAEVLTSLRQHYAQLRTVIDEAVLALGSDEAAREAFDAETFFKAQARIVALVKLISATQDR